MHEVSRPILSYGLEPGADVRGENLRPAGLQTHFDVRRPAAASLAVTVNLAGIHNVLNALAAIAVATELDIDDQAILRALAGFQGVDRRLQHIGDVLTAVGRVSIVDDYAHHPPKWPRRWRPCARATPVGACCSRFSRTATPAPAT